MRNTRENFSLDTSLEEIQKSQEKRELRTVIEARSEASVDHPDRNEDAIFQLPEKNAAGVFDGVGGAAKGEVASAVARDYVASELDKLSNDLPILELEQKMIDILRGAHQAVILKSRQLGEQIGTTAAIVKEVMQDGQKWAVIANAGDSRVYKIKKDGSIEQLTVDDGIIRASLGVDTEENTTKKFKLIEKAREMQKKFNRAKSIDELGDEKFLWKKRNAIFNGLGGEDEINPRIITVPIEEGERLLLASDGFDSVSDNEIENILKRKGGAQEIVRTVKTQSIDKKNWRAKPDDVSVIIVK